MNIFFWSMTLCLIAGPALALNKQDTAEVKALIQAYIQQNPAEIMQAITDHQIAQKMAEVKALIDDTTPVEGPKNAPITIVEFSEFECPFCGRAQTTLQELKQKYPNQIRHAYKHLPLPFHKNAIPAAQASYAAFKQGKFWEFAAEMWPNQQRLSDKLYTLTAEKIGLDMKKFEADRTSAEAQKVVEKNLAAAEKIGAQGTPHFLINGQELSGAQPLAAFEAIIDSILKK